MQKIVVFCESIYVWSALQIFSVGDILHANNGNTYVIGYLQFHLTGHYRQVL